MTLDSYLTAKARTHPAHLGDSIVLLQPWTFNTTRNTTGCYRTLQTAMAYWDLEQVPGPYPSLPLIMEKKQQREWGEDRYDGIQL